MRTVIACLKIFCFLILSLITFVIQWPLIRITDGKASYWWPRIFHSLYSRLLGIKIITTGTIERGENLVYMGNHISYWDIPLIGSLVNGAFVAKKDVETWPFFGAMGKLQHTIYISRNPVDAPKETATLLARLDNTVPMIIFPEGTSSNGTTVFPFKSSFFQIFLNKNIKIQPFTISVLSVDGKPATDQSIRDLYAWYGDMTLEPHLWAFAKGKGAVIKVNFEKPILSSSYNDRKSLCNDVYDTVVKGLDLSLLNAYGAQPDQAGSTTEAGTEHANLPR